MIACDRGSEAIKHLLRTKLHDVRDETPATFARWLHRHLRGWERDRVYKQRVRIREIRRSHPHLQTMEEERRAARADFEAAPEYQQHEKLRRQLSGFENAVAGLLHAYNRAEEENERSRLLEKLSIYELSVADLGAEIESIRMESVAWQRLQKIVTRLADARAESNFDREILELAELQRNHGRSGGKSGSAFESLAADAVASFVLPELGADDGRSEPLVLRRVRLGSSRAEFDQLVVRAVDDPLEPVVVEAAVEAKRNLNDLAHGFRNRVENLAWFSGRKDLYDPAHYRTSNFPDGHFDRPAVHVENGRRHIFTPASFDRFLGAQGEKRAETLPEGMYLVTRPGPLWGLGSGAIARLAHRVASDLAFNLEDQAYLASLLEWTQHLAGDVESPDLLRKFSEDERSARRLLLLSDD